MINKTLCVTVLVFYDGPEDEAKLFFKDIYALQPLVDMTGMKPYIEVNTQIDMMMGHGKRRIMKGTPVSVPNFIEMCDELIIRFNSLVTKYPGAKESSFLIEVHDFAKVSSKPVSATAVGFRGDKSPLSFFAAYEDPDLDKPLREFSKDFAAYVESVNPEEEVKSYPSFALEHDTGHALFGENYPRLQRIKGVWDPDNVFNKW